MRDFFLEVWRRFQKVCTRLSCLRESLEWFFLLGREHGAVFFFRSSSSLGMPFHGGLASCSLFFVRGVLLCDNCCHQRLFAMKRETVELARPIVCMGLGGFVVVGRPHMDQQKGTLTRPKSGHTCIHTHKVLDGRYQNS